MRVRSQISRPKLRPPRVPPDRLERQRLLARLDQGSAGQFTLVAAPAGYGKTTLLAQWIARQDLPVAWLALEESDNELAVFLEDVIAAVGTASPDSLRTIRSLLARPGLPPIELLVRELANDLDELDEFILVLDDCHNLKDPHILQILRNLVYAPPGSLHLVLSSRADPVLPLGALRGRGLLNELRAGDLRFNEEEAVEFLQQALGRSLPESQVRSLVDRTEGWIAGLHLAALSLRGREDVEDRITEFTGSGRYIADYLMEELLTRLDPAVQKYLMATSILKRLTEPLCRAIMDERTIDSVEGRPVLEWLEESNLFVFSLDDQREWFRYHHLFRDLLHHWLEATWPTEDVDALHVRAGEWLAGAGFIDDALGHFLKARRPDLAGDVIEVHRNDAIEQERWRDLERWVRKLGPDIVDARPRLQLIHAWLAHERADWADMSRYCDRVEQLLDLPGERLWDDRGLRGEIAVMRAELGYWLGEGDSTLALARQALTLLPPDRRYVRATATVFEGGGLHLLGQNQAALQVLRDGTSGAYGIGIHPRVMVGLGLLAFMTGDMDQARDVAERMLTRATDLGLEESVGWAHYFLGMVAYLRNDLSAAEDHFSIVDPYASHVFPTKQSFYGLAWIRHAQGRTDEALEVLDRFSSLLSDLSLPLGLEARLLRARLATLSSRPTDELLLARRLLPVERDEPLSLQVFSEFSAISAIAVLVLEGDSADLTACEAGLHYLLKIAEANGNTFRSVQCLILQSLLYDRKDQRTEALAAMARAVERARPGRLIRLFPEMSDRVHPLLQALQLRGRTDPFMDELTESFTPRGLPVSTTPRPHPSTSGQDYVIECLLTSRELDVLELLEERLSNKEIAQRLVISPATVKRHTLSIYSKLGVNSRREATVKAKRLGLLPTPR